MRKIVKNGKPFVVNESKSPVERDFWASVNENRWEDETYRIFDLFLNKRHSYIDIGAWIGPTVLYGSQIAKHCYAIEPDPVAFTALKDNVNLNPSIVNRITLFNGCIGNACGKVRFGTNTSFGDSSSSLLFSGTDAITVDSLTLEEFMRKHSIDDCDFIKMDIEGGEVMVLPAIRGFLRSAMPTLLLSIHPCFSKDRESDARAMLDVLKIYPRIYSTDGRVMPLRKLESLMLSDEKGLSFSVVATSRWGYPGRLRYMLTNALSKLANKLRRSIAKLGAKSPGRQKGRP